jgi:hypothetical protein
MKVEIAKKDGGYNFTVKFDNSQVADLFRTHIMRISAVNIIKITDKNVIFGTGSKSSGEKYIKDFTIMNPNIPVQYKRCKDC